MIPCEFKGRPDRPANPEKMGANGKCIGIARSSFYPEAELPDHAIVSHEWFRPNRSEFKRLGKGSQDHVNQGGLLLRERTDKAPVYHGDTTKPILGPTSDVEIGELVSQINQRNRSQWGFKYF
jgi:hypothetical protein